MTTLAAFACALLSSSAGAVLGWLFTRRHERLAGYVEAVEDAFQRNRAESKRLDERMRLTGFKVYEGGKK